MSGGFDKGFSISPLAGGSGGGGVPLNFSQTKGVQVTITAAEAKPATVVSTTITTQGNPVQIIVAGDANPSAGASWGLLNIYRDGTAVGQLVQFESSAANENVPYCLQVVDEPAAGTWTYSLKVTSVTSDTQFGEAAGPIITVTELGAEAGGGGGVSSVTASPPLASSGGAAPDISITAGSSPGDVLTWDGSAWSGAAPTGGGNISGTLAASEVPFGTAANTISGSSSLTYSSATQDLTVGDASPHSIRIGPYGYVSNPIIESLNSMNINIVDFGGALGIQAANNDLVLIGGDDGGGQSYLQTQPNVRLETQGRLLVKPATDGADAVEVRNTADVLLVQVDTSNKTTTITGDANPALVVASEIDGAFLQVTPTTYELAIFDPLTPTNTVTLNPTDVAVGDGVQSGNISAGRVGVADTGTGNKLSLTLPGAVATLTSEDGATNPFPLNLVIEELQINANPGNAGEVLTSNGPNFAPTWQTGGGAGLGSKVLLVVEGGSYATLQAAVDAASANDVILVGPKAAGNWGNVTLSVVNKPLIIAAIPGAGPNKIVEIGSVTYDLGTTGPALNVNLNETYLYGLYIQGSFAGGSAVTLTGGANYPGRLRLYGCYILNTSATGAAAVTNSNSGTGSSLYLDSCVVSLTPSAAGSTIVQTAGYTVIRNRCDISSSLAVGATGHAINISAGTMEIYESYISSSRAVPTVNVTGGTTFVSAGYSTILNSSDAAGAACVYIGTSGARFGAGDATLAAGSTLPTSAVAVSGVAGGIFLYANVSFSFVSTVSTVTPTATPQSGGLFSYGLSVGTLLGTTFVLNSTGNITKLNNVTTSFPSAQGSANQVLTNNGSGTLTWANGNLRTLGSVGATPTAANLRTNATYTVNVAAVALPAMAAGDDGLTISLVNISGAGSTVTPSTGVSRSMTTGGGQTWVWRNTDTTWYCLSNV